MYKIEGKYRVGHTENLLLTINVGSSSLKSVVYDFDDLSELASGSVEGIHQDNGKSKFVVNSEVTTNDNLTVINHVEALEFVLRAYEPLLNTGRVTAVGHRVVFTGPVGQDTRLIDDQYYSEIASLQDLDPEHVPYFLEVASELRNRFIDSKHIACSDSLFFSDLPIESSILPIPRKYYEQGVKRYGYHGLSYSFLMSRLNEIDTTTMSNKVVLAHLGSGSSLAAVKNGKPIDTTMSFSPTSGIAMSSRSGDMDPGILDYLAKREGMSLDGFNDMVNHHSGLLGISDSSADMLTLLNQQQDDEPSAQAVSVYCYQISKSIGAMAAAMNGIDSIVFSGGVGERSAQIRSTICARLSHLGVLLNDSRNVSNGDIISESNSSVLVRVIPTNEELVIARQVKNFTSNSLKHS